MAGKGEEPRKHQGYWGWFLLKLKCPPHFGRLVDLGPSSRSHDPWVGSNHRGATAFSGTDHLPYSVLHIYVYIHIHVQGRYVPQIPTNSYERKQFERRVIASLCQPERCGPPNSSTGFLGYCAGVYPAVPGWVLTNAISSFDLVYPASATPHLPRVISLTQPRYHTPFSL